MFFPSAGKRISDLNPQKPPAPTFRGRKITFRAENALPHAIISVLNILKPPGSHPKPAIPSTKLPRRQKRGVKDVFLHVIARMACRKWQERRIKYVFPRAGGTNGDHIAAETGSWVHFSHIPLNGQWLHRGKAVLSWHPYRPQSPPTQPPGPSRPQARTPAHPLPHKYIKKLGQLIKAELANPLAHASNTWIISNLENGTGLFVELLKLNEFLLCIDAHATELVHVEFTPIFCYRLSQARAKKLQIWEIFEKTIALSQVN